MTWSWMHFQFHISFFSSHLNERSVSNCSSFECTPKAHRCGNSDSINFPTEPLQTINSAYVNGKRLFSRHKRFSPQAFRKTLKRNPNRQLFKAEFPHDRFISEAHKIERVRSLLKVIKTQTKMIEMMKKKKRKGESFAVGKWWPSKREKLARKSSAKRRWWEWKITNDGEFLCKYLGRLDSDKFGFCWMTN
jgi:hypothetical protein